MRTRVPGLPCLSPMGPGVEEIDEFGPVLRFSKSNSTPSGVFNETGADFLGMKDEEAAFNPLPREIVDDGVEGDGATP